MEAEPVRFLSRELDDRLDAARAALATFVGADPDALAFVTNATSGVNAVLRSLAFAAGDELLTTDHAYNACRNTLDFVAGRAGAQVVVAKIPFPVSTPGEIVDTVLAQVTPRTRLAPLDHITVPTAIDYLGSLVPGGWPALMAKNRTLALEARRLLCSAAGTSPACPDEMIGSLASIILPDGPTTEIGWRRPDPLQQRLFDGWG